MLAGASSRRRVGLLVAVCVLLGAGVGLAADDRLNVTQDENSMERTIKSYLTTAHKMVVKEKVEEGDDLTLILPFEGGPMPAYSVLVDTQSSNRDKETNLIAERGILTNLSTGVNVPPEHRAAVTEVLNDFNRKKIFSCAYIDTDGEIICGWNLNVMAEGLPTEYVYDAVVRVQKNWKEMFPDVAKALS